MSYVGRWQRTQAAKDLYAIEKQLQDGNLPIHHIVPVTVPTEANLPDAYNSGASYTPKNGSGSETVIVSAVPFKIGDRWHWLAVDSEENTVTTGLVRADKFLLRVDPAETYANGEKAYIIVGAGATQGLATNDSAGNDLVGSFLQDDADKIVFSGGAQTAGDSIEWILPDGTYLWATISQ